MFGIQKFDFLIAFYITCVMIAELMGAKTVPLFTIGSFHINGTVSLLVLPLIYSINDVIIEVFGKSRAKSLIRTSLFMILFLLVYSLIATNLPPSQRFLPNEKAYETIFGLSTRFAFASLVAFAVSEFSDVYVFSKLREKLGKSKLWLRTNLSNFISEFLDVAIFMSLAYYALDMSVAANFSFIAGIALPFYLLRCCMSIIETPLVYLGIKWLKKEKK
jgi:uncharacterized integral membrane protein (TIGR00697 family)